VGNELLWQQDDVAPSHPEDFAYELGWVALGETLGDDDGCEAARAMGEALVGCEEMQAIRAYLRWAHTSTTEGDLADEPLLPMSVIAWMEVRDSLNTSAGILSADGTTEEVKL
jgi:hypothetical protein